MSKILECPVCCELVPARNDALTCSKSRCRVAHWRARSAVKPVMCIVPVSGGKDSQACLKMAVEEFGAANVLGLFCDTQFEHPKTYAHVKRMAKLYGVKVRTISGGSVADKIRKHQRFPGGGARFCTDELKIRETRIFLAEFVKTNGPFQVWYGMRTDESSERSKRYAYKDPDDLYEPHEVLAKYPKYLGEAGIRYRLPIVDWTTAEVMEYLDGEENPLYREGFDRVGCFPCLASGDKWKIKAFTHDKFGESQLIVIRKLEEEIGKSVFTSGIGADFDDNSQGCRTCEI